MYVQSILGTHCTILQSTPGVSECSSVGILLLLLTLPTTFGEPNKAALLGAGWAPLTLFAFSGLAR